MKLILLIASVVINSFAAVFAGTTATATVTYTIGSIDSIAISGDPATLTVSTAVPGNPPSICVDSTTTYAITTNCAGRKITGALDSSLPVGVSLGAELAAPTNATSSGSVDLTTTPQNLVTGISNIAEGGLTIAYCLCTTVDASQTAGATTTVTYTITP